MISADDYLQHDGLGLAALVRDRQVTPAELLEVAIARAEAVNPKVNAVVIPMHEIARQRAQQALAGPFAGVPFLVKDVIQDYAGVPTTVEFSPEMWDPSFIEEGAAQDRGGVLRPGEVGAEH